jgi:hypothetical protein
MEKREVLCLLDDLHEEQALAIGGLIATHPVEDDFVWRLFRSLEVVRQKALRRLEGSDLHEASGPARRTFPEPHPAIEEFLAGLGRASR